jgi:hypothetical protein
MTARNRRRDRTREPNVAHRIGKLAFLLIPLVACLPAGCPSPTAATPWNGDELASGLYWVEDTADGLFCYELPKYAGAAQGRIEVPAEASAPGWYAGPAVYEHADDGTWTLTGGAGQTLDDVIQTWDPLPNPEEPTPA